MTHPDHPHPKRLLEYQLGLLEEANAAQVRAELAASAEAASCGIYMAEWVDLLSIDEAPEPPADMVDRIMGLVGETTPLRITEAASALPPASTGGAFRRPVLSLRELVALAACITFFIGVLVPGVSRTRSLQRQTMCANNLGGLYQGLAQYAGNFNGNMPQTAGFVPGGNWLRSPEPDVPRMSNSRNRYLVVRLRFVSPDKFICPAVKNARPMDPVSVESLDDFPVPESCSFDSQNVAGPTVALNSGYRVPIYADRNPLFDGGIAAEVGSAEVNSRSHDGGRGQNVLFSDGEVGWLETPVYGPHADNMWRIEGVTEYTGTEYQRHPADAFVIP